MTSRHHPPTAATSSSRETAREWITEFLAKPHECIGRSGAVCPFVEPSMKAGTLEIRQWDTAPDIDVDAMVTTVRRMAQTFGRIPWAGRNRTLRALVVVLPSLGPDRFGVLDRAHAVMKTELAWQGLMLGQFHAACQERAARNSEFLVSRSPVPLLALRHMAFHDVMFLHSDPQWFAAYRERYGKRYLNGSVPDPLFAKIFAQAQRTWGEQAAAGPNEENEGEKGDK